MSAQPPAEPRNISAATGEPVPDCAFEPAPPASPRLSFKGWALSVWLVRNKGFVKTVLAPCSAIMTGGVFEPSMLKPAAVTFGLGLLTIAFRLGWDAFDYFLSEQPMEPRT